MSKGEDKVRLQHMLDATVRALSMTEGSSRVDLDTDEKLALAIVRLIEIIGEAGRRVSETTRERFSELEWKGIIGARDRLIHGYDKVDLDVVWRICTEDLPLLVKQLQAIIDEMQ